MEIMLQILVGILIVVLIVLAVIFFYQRRITNVVKKLDDRLQQLDVKQLEQKLSKDNLSSLMGDSLKHFTEIREEYDTKFAPSYEQANVLVDQIQRDLHGKNVFNSSSQVSQLQKLMATLDNEYESIQKQLKVLDDTVTNQEKAIKDLRDQYNNFGRELDQKSFGFGDSKKELQNRLIQLEKKYEHFSSIAQKGDHESAQELLNDLNEQTQEFSKLISQIPSLYRPLYAVFPDQLNELQTGYEKLVKDHYHFTEKDISKQVQELNKQREIALQKLSHLNIEPVKKANKHLADEIDRLYDVMQKEIDAKPLVVKNLTKTDKHVIHAQQQNRELMAELQKLSKSYTLNHNEIADTRQLDQQLKDITKQFNDDRADVLNHQAVYSMVWKSLQNIEKSLTEIEQQQKNINDGVASLRADEQRAQNALQRFIADIRATKRRVESLNLPGVPQDYLDYFFVVSDEITKLSEAMNQDQINMEDITKQLLIVQDDLETLHDRTDNLRDSAALTERMIQYGNRLSGNNAKIDQAIQKAQHLFNQHEYSAALETIGTALEEVEPGAFKQIEKEYYDGI